MAKAAIADLEAFHGSPDRQACAMVAGDSSCTIMRTADLLPTVPERWPRLPLTGRVFLSSPNEISPGPISTRCPSIDLTNQRPDNDTIDRGFGFSCQSPIQPTGSTVTKHVRPILRLRADPLRRCFGLDCSFLELAQCTARLVADALGIGPQMPVGDGRFAIGVHCRRCSCVRL